MYKRSSHAGTIAGKLTRWENARNVFSHSLQCDEFFSQPSNGGVEHQACRCWCHNAGETLYLSEAPEYDLTPPPEYATSADRIEEGEPEYVRAIPIEDENKDRSVDVLYSDDLFEDQSMATKYPGRSREELRRNRCDTCGDSLAICECVEG